MNHLDNHDLNPDGILARYGDGLPGLLRAGGDDGRVGRWSITARKIISRAAQPNCRSRTRRRSCAPSPNYDFFRRLLTTYQTHPALSEGAFTKVPSDHDDAVYAFAHFRGDDRVLVVLNLLGYGADGDAYGSAALPGRYRDAIHGERSAFRGERRR